MPKVRVSGSWIDEKIIVIVSGSECLTSLGLFAVPPWDPGKRLGPRVKLKQHKR